MLSVVGHACVVVIKGPQATACYEGQEEALALSPAVMALGIVAQADGGRGEQHTCSSTHFFDFLALGHSHPFQNEEFLVRADANLAQIPCDSLFDTFLRES